MTTQPDIRVENHGSLFLFSPVTPAGRAWIATTAPKDAQYWCEALVVEHRYAPDVARHATYDGLVLS